MYLLFLYGLIVLIVGLIQKDKKLQLVGGIGMALAAAAFVAMMVLFAFSDM